MFVNILYIIDCDSKLSCPDHLRPGDIYTHTFHGHKSTIVDFDQCKVHPVIHKSHQNGVLFDVGHGRGSFNWKVCLIKINYYLIYSHHII